MWAESTHYKTWFYYQEDLDWIRSDVNQRHQAPNEPVAPSAEEPQPSTRREERYKKTALIGSGAFGLVYKAIDTRDNDRVVAIKTTKPRGRHQDDMHTSVLREIKLLNELHHPNIISLLNVVECNYELRLVLDYAETDLGQIIADHSIYFRLSNIKAYALMILRGLDYLHQRWILHRDLKPANLLVNAAGILKIADFGLSKNFGLPLQYMTPGVVTRWYRSPELLMAADHYGVGVDMWSVGCIIAELVERFPFFPSVHDSDLDQLVFIYEKMGSPTEISWPGMTSLKGYVQMKHHFEGRPLHQLLPSVAPDLLHLLQLLLQYNPRQRINCRLALNMEFFSCPPAPRTAVFIPASYSVSIVPDDVSPESDNPLEERPRQTCSGLKRKSNDRVPDHRKLKYTKVMDVSEEKQLVSKYELFLSDLAHSFTPPIPFSVVWTALNYMKRFYLLKSVVEYHPKSIALTCLYLAIKVDEHHISTERFLDTLASRHLFTTRTELHRNQLIVMRHIYYHLALHTPFRCIEEFLINVEYDCPTYDSKYLQSEIDYFLYKFIRTDGVFLHSPVRIGLAAITYAARKINDQIVEKYLNDNFSRDMEHSSRSNLKQSLEKIIALVHC